MKSLVKLKVVKILTLVQEISLDKTVPTGGNKLDQEILETAAILKANQNKDGWQEKSVEFKVLQDT